MMIPGADMEENSEDSAVCSWRPKDLQFRTAGFELTNLRGATIHVRFIVRHKRLGEAPQLKAFWKAWIEKSNGKLDWPG
jgi:hypothetical protein